VYHIVQKYKILHHFKQQYELQHYTPKISSNNAISTTMGSSAALEAIFVKSMITPSLVYGEIPSLLLLYKLLQFVSPNF